MTDRSTDILNTIGEICTYTGRSEATIRHYIDTMDFPAVKIDGHSYSSKKSLIEKWYTYRIVARNPLWLKMINAGFETRPEIGPIQTRKKGVKHN